MTGRRFIIALLSVQALCAVVVVADTFLSLFGLYFRPIPWHLRELLELGAALGLVLGLTLGGIAFFQVGRARDHAEEQLRRVSGVFLDLLQERFAQWGLTPAEADVAMFAIKGFSIQEIALMRQTSDGTVKAQTNAIYRKAGVTGRPQLLSLVIEDLIEGRPVERIDLARAG